MWPGVTQHATCHGSVPGNLFTGCTRMSRTRIGRPQAVSRQRRVASAATSARGACPVTAPSTQPLLFFIPLLQTALGTNAFERDAADRDDDYRSGCWPLPIDGACTGHVAVELRSRAVA